MTLSTLLLNVGIAAVLLSLVTEYLFKARKNWVVTFLQNYCGALFIFSGWVKAVDPLGTAYKMEQYFDQFETHFSWIGGLFPILSDYAISFSVFMIVFEIVLGIMLILGSSPKFTSWAFLLLVAFFTLLTGFTYLTGYLTGDATFFEFAQWGAYDKNNMKVTDCGCFGDYLKLEPKISFYKDLALLIPAVFFIFKFSDMHQWFTPSVRRTINGVGIGALTVYCLSNFLWDIPGQDFRPFKEGVNVKAQKDIEEAAMANVAIIGWVMENEQTGEVVPVPNPAYKEVVAEYPKDKGWKVKDQMKSEPTLEPSKISDFAVEDIEGNDVTEEILNMEGYSLMLVSHKMYYDGSKDEQKLFVDTLYVLDTIATADTMYTVRKPQSIKERTETVTSYTWNKDWEANYKNKVNPFANSAMKNGVTVYGIVGGAGADMINDFRTKHQIQFPFYKADDILLKTIVRSNPGMVLFKDGTILKKWHINKLPSFEEVKAEFME